MQRTKAKKLFFIFFIVLMFSMGKILYYVNGVDEIITSYIPFEYSSLFTSRDKIKLTPRDTELRKNKLFFSYFFYKDSIPFEYGVWACKVKLSDRYFTLNSIVEKQKDILIKENNYDYLVENYEFKQIKDSTPPISRVSLLFGGDTLTTLSKNDSVAYYVFNLNEFAISFNDACIPDIYMRTYRKNDIYQGLKIEMMIRKYNGCLYFLFLHSNVSHKFSDTLLYNITNLTYSKEQCTEKPYLKPIH